MSKKCQKSRQLFIIKAICYHSPTISPQWVKLGRTKPDFLDSKIRKVSLRAIEGCDKKFTLINSTYYV